MKKLIAIISIIAMVASISTSAFAAFTPDSAITKTAYVTVSGTPAVQIPLTVKVKEISDNIEKTSVIWSGVSAGSVDWKAADRYLEISGFATFAQWGIQIYTDNKAVPNQEGDIQYIGTGDPAGLVNVSTKTSTLPMCWRVAINSSIRDSRFAAGSLDLQMQEKYIATGTAAGKTVILRNAADYVNDSDFYAPWAWTLDKTDLDPDTAGVQQYSNYTSLIVSGNVHIAAGENSKNYVAIPERAAKYCVYLGAKFTGAAAGVSYKTTELTVEMYHL